MAKKSKNSLNRKMTFSGMQVMLFVLAFAAVGAVAVWQSLAAPHNSGHGATGTIAMRITTDNNADGLPNWGDTITYDVSTTATTAPSVKTSCVQNGAVVLYGDTSFYAGNPFAYTNFLALNSGIWTSGAGDCTATMYYNSGKKVVTLNTLNFHVDP
jgi:hypothetical protein